MRDLYMPIGGEIVAVNLDLENTPERINRSPYDDGWIINVRPSDVADIENLLDDDAYQRICEAS